GRSHAQNLAYPPHRASQPHRLSSRASAASAKFASQIHPAGPHFSWPARLESTLKSAKLELSRKAKKFALCGARVFSGSLCLCGSKFFNHRGTEKTIQRG